MKLYPKSKIKIIGPGFFHSVFINIMHILISVVMNLWIVQMRKNKVYVRFLVLLIHYSSWFIQVFCNVSLYRITLGNVLAFHHYKNIVGHQLIEKMLILLYLF